MLLKCSNIIYINFISFDSKISTNMSFIFENCENLININFSSLNTKN